MTYTIVCYDAAIAEDPERCMVRFRGGETGMAVSRMELGRDGGPAMSYIYKGDLLARLGRHEEAVDACSAGLRASPGNPELLACMASSMAVLGRRRRAAIHSDGAKRGGLEVAGSGMVGRA